MVFNRYAVELTDGTDTNLFQPTSMNLEAVLQYINTHSLTGIKAGSERSTFLSIWMVVVDKRIFARSWGLAKKSWYNCFLQQPTGFIQCGEDVVKIKATIPADLDSINERINAAYLEKYNSEHNISYAKGIVEYKHAERTMEFILDEEHELA